MTLGQRLKEARKLAERKKGRPVTQQDVANAAGLSKVTITKIETDKLFSMQAEPLAHVAELLDCDFWWLAAGDKARPESLVSVKSVDLELEPVPQKEDIETYMEIAAEMHAVSGQLINFAKEKMPTNRLVKRLHGLSKELIGIIPVKPRSE